MCGGISLENQSKSEPFVFGMKPARHYGVLLDSGKLKNRVAVARHLSVSRARVTQVLRRLASVPVE